MSNSLHPPADFLGDYNVHKDDAQQTITVFADLYLYGSVASEDLANRVAYNVHRLWNGPEILLTLNDWEYLIRFQVRGMYTETPWELIRDNPDYKRFFIRIEPETDNPLDGISYMDGLNCNTGFFRLDNVAYEGATTEAHEIGHGWGLVPGSPDGHPYDLNLIGKGQPGTMYPRGTLVDPEYQWSPVARPGEFGGTLKPDKRIVTLEDVAMLGLDQLRYDRQGRARLGGLTNRLHEPNRPLPLA